MGRGNVSQPDTDRSRTVTGAALTSRRRSLRWRAMASSARWLTLSRLPAVFALRHEARDWLPVIRLGDPFTWDLVFRYSESRREDNKRFFFTTGPKVALLTCKANQRN